MLLASVTKAQDDLDKTINLLGERLEDWYGIYFPELRAEDKLKYAEVSLIIDRENFDESTVLGDLGPQGRGRPFRSVQEEPRREDLAEGSRPMQIVGQDRRLLGHAPQGIRHLPEGDRPGAMPEPHGGRRVRDRREIGLPCGFACETGDTSGKRHTGARSREGAFQAPQKPEHPSAQARHHLPASEDSHLRQGWSAGRSPAPSRTSFASPPRRTLSASGTSPLI